MSNSRLYEECTVIDINDPKKLKRVKVRFDRNGVESGWIKAFHPVFGSGRNGTYGKLKKDDVVIVSFLDYPRNLKPFIFAKNKSANDSIVSEDSDVMFFRGHKISFKDDCIDISFKSEIEVTDNDKDVTDNRTTIRLKSDSIEFLTALPFQEIKIGSLNLLEWLMSHTIVGSFGIPLVVTPPDIQKVANGILTSKKITFGG